MECRIILSDSVGRKILSESFRQAFSKGLRVPREEPLVAEGKACEAPKVIVLTNKAGTRRSQYAGRIIDKIQF